MSAPFGGHPTLGEYLDWAYRFAECTVQTGFINGRPCKKIVAPSGRWVTIVDKHERERLAPTTVDYFDRRLGIKSPFASLPSAPYQN